MIVLLVILSSLCVWRNPERDIKDFFGSGSYQTVYYEITREEQDSVEKILGKPLDPDESEFKFYPVFKKGEEVGTVATHLSKGQYGAIEVILAIEYGGDKKDFKVRAVRIQRDREKARAALRSSNFLNQFKDKTLNDSLTVGIDIKPAAPGAEKSSAAIAFAVKKLLLVFDIMVNNKK